MVFTYKAASNLCAMNIETPGDRGVSLLKKQSGWMVLEAAVRRGVGNLFGLAGHNGF